MFEICYGSGCLEGGSTTRRQFLTNALQLVKLSKGKGIILSAEASQIMFLRSPVDVQVIANMLGITNTQDSIATVRENCLKVF
jgi:ribonuclease P/MRP protein subunit RPP1